MMVPYTDHDHSRCPDNPGGHIHRECPFKKCDWYMYEPLPDPRIDPAIETKRLDEIMREHLLESHVIAICVMFEAIS